MSTWLHTCDSFSQAFPLHFRMLQKLKARTATYVYTMLMLASFPGYCTWEPGMRLTISCTVYVWYGKNVLCYKLEIRNFLLAFQILQSKCQQKVSIYGGANWEATESLSNTSVKMSAKGFYLWRSQLRSHWKTYICVMCEGVTECVCGVYLVHVLVCMRVCLCSLIPRLLSALCEKSWSQTQTPLPPLLLPWSGFETSRK